MENGKAIRVRIICWAFDVWCYCYTTGSQVLLYISQLLHTKWFWFWCVFFIDFFLETHTKWVDLCIGWPLRTWPLFYSRYSYSMILVTDPLTHYSSCQESWEGKMQQIYGAFTNITQFLLPFTSIFISYTKVCDISQHFWQSQYLKKTSPDPPPIWYVIYSGYYVLNPKIHGGGGWFSPPYH